ncbi:OmpH family outer membrane protein [Pseudodesulfovibrio cashew]|uniref:OmpH family outer membrane protein n=1 Tax=Pseudodesulfovibrio cashew TaxID=2678688 RepID=A0A6I6JK55_9BACT|nr:OmpH family outer membrane protein [Pseudodesulfovibrio cashew]QGY40692.1 OmpH family outer membrane protein [Pseudodesulfovibrio cashew]
MKLLKIYVALLALILACPVWASAKDSKVGYVNPQRIVSESRIGLIAQEDLARLGKEKDRRVRESLREVETLKQKLEKSTLSVTEQQSVEQALRLAARRYEDLVQASNQDIQNEERRLIQFVMRRADSILRRIARDQGFTMILTDPAIIGYVDASMDITDQVISQLNSML